MRRLGDIKKILRRCRLFSTLSEESLEVDVLPYRRQREFAKSDIIIAPQQRVDRFAVLLQGRVHISQLFSSGAFAARAASGVRPAGNLEVAHGAAVP